MRTAVRARRAAGTSYCGPASGGSDRSRSADSDATACSLIPYLLGRALVSPAIPGARIQLLSPDLSGQAEPDRFGGDHTFAGPHGPEPAQRVDDLLDHRGWRRGARGQPDGG